MENIYETDSPLKNSEKDKLNRLKFVEILSQSINAYDDKEDCLVIGLMGEWGCGKTSIINMVYGELEKYNAEKKPYEKWILTKFNPWYFSKQDTMLIHFFDFLMSEINKTDPVNKILEGVSKLKNKLLDDFSLTVGVPGIGVTYNPDRDTESYDSFDSIKHELKILFKGMDYKIVISIDDIDRLTDSEMQQIFLLVKSLADFPNVIYILSFDKNVALKALNNLQVYSPEKFLEKIIQIPIMVPEITQSRLDLLIEEKIRPIYEKNNTLHYNDFSAVLEILKPFFKNIRDLKRYTNIVNFYINQFKDEVNIGDFLIMSALQLFEYNIYSLIRENKDLLTDHELMKSFDDETQRKMYEDFINELKTEHYSAEIKPVINHLFRNFNDLEADIIKDTDEDYLYESRLNVCSNVHFDKYFTLSTELDEVSQKVIDQLLILEDKNKIYEIIYNLVKSGKSKSLFKKIKSSTYRIESKNYEYFIESLFRISNHTNYSQELDELLNSLFNSMYDEEESYRLLKNAIKPQSLYQVCKFIHNIGSKFGFYNGDFSKEILFFYITLEQFKELQQTALEEIIKCSKNNTLLLNPKGIELLEYWRIWGDKKDVIKFVNKNTDSNAKLLTFIKKYQNKDFNNITEIPPQDLWKLFDYDKIFEFLDEDNVIGRIRSISKNKSMKNEHEFCEIFLKWYDENGITIP